jgi:hypothetical protein
LTVGKNVAQRAVVRRKHLLREPHLMPVSHTNLSLNQAHCRWENAPQVCELPVFSLFLTRRGYRLECYVTGLIFGLASLVEQRLAENQQNPGSAEGDENTTSFSLLQVKWRVEFRPEVEQAVAEAAAWYDAQQPVRGRVLLRKLFAFGMLWQKIRCSIVVVTRRGISDDVTRSDSLTAWCTKWLKRNMP